MNNDNKLKEILSQLDSSELEELLSIVKENKTSQGVSSVNKKGKFSMKEIDFLSEYYPKHGIKWCCDHLDRTILSIEKKVKKLGLVFHPTILPNENPNIFKPTKIYASPIDTTTPRNNLFLNFKPNKKEQKELNKDSLIDKLLSKDLTPASRDRNPNMIQVECSKCHRSTTVNRKIVGNIERFKCNACMVRHR